MTDVIPDVQILEVGPPALAEYDRIPSAFEIRTILEVQSLESGLGGLRLVEVPVPQPYVKDYDAYEDGPPSAWVNQFDISNWGILLARAGQQPVGAAAIAFNTAGVNMLEGRSDLAVLWDIRVHPDWRRLGLSRRLLKAAADWASLRGCTMMKIETQNVNISACRFYASQGCQLGAIHRFGYITHPLVSHEAMLLWYLHLPYRSLPDLKENKFP
ncbi:MAG: GNAT family N-acetyltransferase [Chloroflexota bacterium]